MSAAIAKGPGSAAIPATAGIRTTRDPRRDGGLHGKGATATTRTRRLYFSLALEPNTLYANVVHISKTRAATSILSVRVTPDERQLLDAAASKS